MDANYWENRYRNGATGWDIGSPSTPLKEFIDTLTNQDIDILIPGCGNAYEGSYLFQSGFRKVKILDYASDPLLEFRSKNPDFPQENLIHDDFFNHEGHYDLIIEQTFFCALSPELRRAYAEKMERLLKPGGRLVGLLFNCSFEQEGPPFGGEESEYRQYFDKKFIIHKMEACYNSIAPRAGKELFINLIKP
ncbi:MAG: methyltransferase domain-containing protein [Bacteroidetes bacterium]|nr:methyltransferase domain-containing protein [Bacteroidota bacterium]